MFNKENPISLEWEKREASLSPEVKSQLNDLDNSHGRNFDKWQLKVIKRTRKYPEKGDVFVYSPRENVFFYGIVIDDNAGNLLGEHHFYVVALFKDKNHSLKEINFAPKEENILCPPMIVSRLYWTKGFFYNVDSIEKLPIEIDYGFYDVIGKKGYVDKNENCLNYVPKLVKAFGICSDVGVAINVNVELIINKELLEFE
jgi:hypothetical protein